MKRYITINAYSGYIWGDTLSLPPKDRTAIEAAYDIDYDLDPSNIEGDGLIYEQGDSFSSDGKGCFVYLVPADSDIPLVTNGQDQEMIERVTSTCKVVAHVIARNPETGAES